MPNQISLNCFAPNPIRLAKTTLGFLACGVAAITSSAQTALSSIGNAGVPRAVNALGVSADGQAVVGTAVDENGKLRAYRWAGGSLELISFAPVYGDGCVGVAISGDGNTVVGMSRGRAFRWKAGSGAVDLGEWAVTGVNWDGSVIVGSNHSFGSHAVRWDSASGLVDLGDLDEDNGGHASAACGVSADGNVVAGFTDYPVSFTRAFQWTSEGGMQALGTLGGEAATGTAISSDGQVIVGQSNRIGGGNYAFRWSQQSGIQDLGESQPDWNSIPAASNAAGTAVGGGWWTVESPQSAFLWSEAIGMVDLNSYLPQLGVALPNWKLFEITGFNTRGTVIVGRGSRNGQQEGWIVKDLPPPCLGVRALTPSRTICPFEAATFVADVAGGDPYTVTWEAAASTSGPWTVVTNGENLGPLGAIAFSATGAETRELSVFATSGFADAWQGTDGYLRYRVTNECDTWTSPPITFRACAADVTCDETVGLTDFFEFLNCLDQTLPCADVTGEGAVDLADFFGFLNAFDQGC